MKLTEQQLNARIAREREQSIETCGALDWPPNYTGDMNPATQLANEFANATLHFYGSDKGFGFFASVDNEDWETDTYHETNPMIAISLAWLQWKTGETVEVE